MRYCELLIEYLCRSAAVTYRLCYPIAALSRSASSRPEQVVFFVPGFEARELTPYNGQDAAIERGGGILQDARTSMKGAVRL